MKTKILLSILLIPIFCLGALKVGVGKEDITPPIGTPSAGYVERKGAGMQGIHDPLFATALFIDNGEKKIAFCSVDNLGFTYEIIQEITSRVKKIEGLSDCEVYVASTHTHSGGGAFLNIPIVGEGLAGKYDQKITEFYIETTTRAIEKAFNSQMEGKIGFGYGKAKEISTYRGAWPKNAVPLFDISVIKVVTTTNQPLALLFNYPLHPTILGSENRQFSSDFVGYTRNYLENSIGEGVLALYFNGAQGDIVPIECKEVDSFNCCQLIGESLGESVLSIWDAIQPKKSVQIFTKKESYSFKPLPTPFGIKVPIDTYKSELNLIVFNKKDAFITIPGELSCIYDRRLKEMGRDLGFDHVSFFGLTNDAHGYIILPESWRQKTMESGLSFGGENYGEQIENKILFLLESGRSWTWNFNDPPSKWR